MAASALLSLTVLNAAPHILTDVSARHSHLDTTVLCLALALNPKEIICIDLLCQMYLILRALHFWQRVVCKNKEWREHEKNEEEEKEKDKEKTLLRNLVKQTKMNGKACCGGVYV